MPNVAATQFPVSVTFACGARTASGVSAGGVTDVQDGNWRISYASLDDLLPAYAWLARQLGIDTTERPRRRVACVSKGLSGPGATTSGGGLGAGREHAESGPDALWSRQVPGVPGHVPDIDWEQR